MRVFETHVQELKNDVLRSVARLAWDNDLQTGTLDIPEQIIPGPEAKMRCCIYKERAIIGQRVKIAMGGDRTNPNLVEVLDIACDECPVTEISVGPSCRGCIATRCVHACPKDAIIVVDRKAQIDPNKCISCGACVYQCPFGAIMDKSYLVDAIQMLKGAERWGYRVYAAVAPSIAGQFTPATLGQVVAGLKEAGFQGVAEVALGADMVARAESEELVEKGKLTSSCCPAFVDYVEKYHPQEAALVSHTPSPMVMTARWLKEKDPGCKVIFIGPCVAKKKEFQLGKTMGAVDCVLTFEELYPLFQGRDIDITALEEAPLDQASGFGRAFAHSGGVAAAVAQALKERGVTEEQFKLCAAPCSGIDACKAAVMKLGRGIGDTNFVEGMACEGGCVQGAGVLIRSPKNQADVDRHAKAAGGRTIAQAVEGAGPAAE